MLNLTLILLLTFSVAQNNTYCMHSDCGESLRFNCADYSKTLVLLLRENGFNAYPVFGYIRREWVEGVVYGKPHNWVRIEIYGIHIDIEPQTGIEVTNNPEYQFRYRGVVRGLW